MKIAEDINQLAVSEMAALLYWTQAEENGVAATTAAIVETDGAAIFAHSSAESILTPFGFEQLNFDRQEAYREAIIGYALDHAVEQRNMIGNIYLEDAATGRSDTAAQLNTAPLAHIPQLIIDRAIESCGRLCLRHPLPAVVFADAIPQKPYCLVDDTLTALGFDLPMILTLDGQSRLHDDGVILTGIFHIPVPNAKAGAVWNDAIQNSMRYVDGTTIISETGVITVLTRW
jgi:hypothetical protein